MLSNFRERVDIPSQFKSILESYPFGNALLREPLQNSDDAGASHQTFILDRRRHGTAYLVDSALKDSQGPALLFANDTKFNDSDWKAVSTIHGSNKKTDETKIGKFGLGFRSCYHVTDNPHILSGSTLVVFDPHEEFGDGKTGGVKIDISSALARETYKDQLAAFGPLLPLGAAYFQGTIVRLPLRTFDQSSRSKIKQQEVRPDEINRLFTEFIEKEMDISLLFLKHVSSLELREITETGEEMFLASVRIENIEEIGEQRAFSRDSGAISETFRCIVASSGPIVDTSRTWRIHHSMRSAEEASELMSERLGLQEGVRKFLKADKLFAHVALAIPLDKAIVRGRLFALLPLPIYTGFPLHVHSILALTHDRQSLRNREETGLSPKSRERIAIEWNDAIFDTFVPSAWTDLLERLISEKEITDIWSAWPSSSFPEHPSGYWNNITSKLLSEVISHDLTVFPKMSNGPIEYTSIRNSLIASPYDNQDVLAALVYFGFTITQPPPHIFPLLVSLLDPLEYRRIVPAIVHCLFPVGQEAAAKVSPLLGQHAETGINFFINDPRIVATSRPPEDALLDFLVLSPLGDIRYLINLPLVPLISGMRATLHCPDTLSQKNCTHILVSPEEKELFGQDNMVALSDLSSDLQQVFRSPASAHIVNIAVLNAEHVLELLGNTPLLTLAAANNKVGSAEARIPWLIKFWAWMDQWENTQQLLPFIDRFYLLPTDSGRCERVQDHVLLPPPDNDVAHVFSQLRVPFLHSDLRSSSSLSSNGIAEQPDRIAFLVEHIDPSTIGCIDTYMASIIQQYLLRSLANHRSGPLSNPQRLLQLPIFPILVLADNFDTQRGTGTIIGRLICVSRENNCPLPRLPYDHTYVDMSDPSHALATLVDSDAVAHPWDEIAILELSIKHLGKQPHVLLDKLVPRIISRFSDIPKASIKKFRRAPFIETRAGSRLPSKDVIDPQSDLAALYEGENEKLPAHRFATRDVLPVLQHDGFFQRTLSRELVLERIGYISGLTAGSASFKKALAFLRLLDNSWSDSFFIPDELKWLPSTDGTLHTASECRDKGDDVYSYDLVLDIVPYKITSLGLRKALGWTTHVSFLTLALQFREAIHQLILPSAIRRWVYLIKNTAALYDSGNISTEGLEVLRTVVIKDHPWIPVSLSESAPIVSRKHFVASRFAILDGDMARKIGVSFKQITSSLMTEPTVSFLIAMGCSIRPPLDALLDELKRLSSVPHSISSILTILEEVARHTDKDHVDEETRARILVPDHNEVLRTSKEIVFNDSDTAMFDLPEQRVPTHARISKSLASSLGLEFASSLSLGSDDDDEDMAEDITIRIRGILRDYDASYAINEFIANAVDAGATSFSAIYDGDSYGISSILSRDMSRFQYGPALILHNDAEMKITDFTGLCRIGQGGKKGQFDTIGHFGLGALSFFHFADMVMIISGDYVMFLDPTGVHLPPRKGRKRTALRMRLESLVMRYPDQLSTLDGHCGFKSSAVHYKGTLFRLPLRKGPGPLSTTVTSPSEVLNLLRTPYYDLAHDALFFTALRYVEAEHHSEGTRSPLWSVLKDIQEDNCDGNFNEQDVRLTLSDARGIRRETWMVISLVSPLDSIPREHRHAVDNFQPMRTGLRTATALRLHDTSKEKVPRLTERFLFSSMRLPVTTSLPVHIHAPFALASDRRGIRFDPPNTEGERIPDAAYNCWILTDVIPELYRHMLAQVLVFEDVNNLKGPRPGPNQWLPSLKETKDPISKEIVRAFYRTLPTSTRAVFRSVSGALVKPKEAILCHKLPSLIYTILTDLKPDELVDLPTDILNMIFKESSESPSIKTVTPQYLRDLLVARADDFRATKIWADRSTGPNPGEIDTIITYLLNDKHLTASSLMQTPLLLDSNRSLECFGHRCPVYYLQPGQADMTSLFPAIPSHFIHSGIPKKTIQLILTDNRLGLRIFDAAAAATLTREQIQTTVPYGSHCTHPNAISRWICDQFWPSYMKIPGPPLEFRSLPLVPTNLDNEFVSLNYCDEGYVFAYSTLRSELIPIIEKLGIPVLNRDPPAALRVLLGKSRSSLESFLCCLSLQNTSLDSLSPGDLKELGSWMQSQLMTKGQMTTLLQKNPSLQHLPIWSVRRDGKREFKSLEHIWMLPNEMDIELMSRFMGARMCIVKHNSCLKMLMEVAYPLSHSKGSAILDDITHNLQWSDLAQDLESFCQVLKQIFKAFPTGDLTGLRAVNGNRELTDVHTLYDNSIPVFQSAFHRTRNTHFVHKSLHSLQPQLHRAGLIHKITHHEFMNCVQAIDEDLIYLSADEVRPRAETIYSYYRNNLPAQIMTARYLWDGFNDLRFIPRRGQRHEFAGDMDRYCVQLPMIISPNEVVREEYQAISWSQRGVAAQQPPSGLQAVNPSFGVPRVADVVQHLVVLSQQVALERDHGESDACLLSDLDATYRWLDSHAGEARMELLLEGEALFLNVDEPESDAWVWKPARDLAFNLIFDAEGLSAVRTYLLPFKALILAAGASELSEATLVKQGQKTSQADAQADSLRRTFNKMREEGELTDIALTVMYPDDGPTLSEGANLQAHASFLGASIDHVRSSLMRLREMGADTSHYEFPGTVFGACTVLDFIYKGEMKISTPQTSDEATFLLQELRALLDVCEAWDMQELKEEVGAHIVNEGLINPETYNDIWRDAEEFNAESLAKSCAKYKADNRDVLQKLLLLGTG